MLWLGSRFKVYEVLSPAAAFDQYAVRHPGRDALDEIC
jgi:hypothetical protein